MMFPIRDENPQLQVPFITYSLIAVNVIAWLALQRTGIEPALSASVCQYGLIPADLTGTVSPGLSTVCSVDGQPDWHTVITSMFMHGSWMHLLGNMWFLWIFGNNVEDAMGPILFTFFYLLSGLAASAAQVLADLHSTIPMVGASGAIGGVMGAYIVLYPKVHVHMLLFLVVFVRTFAIPAIAMLGYWIVVQIFGAVSSMGASGGGVAFWAHIGGFIAGMLLIFLFKDESMLAKHPFRGWKQNKHPDTAWKSVSNKGGTWN